MTHTFDSGGFFTLLVDLAHGAAALRRRRQCAGAQNESGQMQCQVVD